MKITWNIHILTDHLFPLNKISVFIDIIWKHLIFPWIHIKWKLLFIPYLGMSHEVIWSHMTSLPYRKQVLSLVASQIFSFFFWIPMQVDGKIWYSTGISSNQPELSTFLKNFYSKWHFIWTEATAIGIIGYHWQLSMVIQ